MYLPRLEKVADILFVAIAFFFLNRGVVSQIISSGLPFVCSKIVY